MNLDNLARSVHYNATEKGFWDYMYSNVEPVGDTFVFFAKQIAMIHSEATEVLEALRKQKGAGEVTEELADIIIRVVDLYQGLVMAGEAAGSLEDIVTKKTIINSQRPKMHGVLG
jgi:NTP pyrophosphatase (non-canonical NTP hydrolase)